MKPRWTGIYDLRRAGTIRSWFLWRKPIYEFRNCPHRPLTLELPGGRRIRPDNHFLTDLGSIPPFLTPLYGSASFEPAFILHDSGYEDHGLWVANPGADIFLFVRMDRRTVDRLLRIGVWADDGNRVDRTVIYGAVRAGGWGVWRRRAEYSIDKRRGSLLPSHP